MKKIKICLFVLSILLLTACGNDNLVDGNNEIVIATMSDGIYEELTEIVADLLEDDGYEVEVLTFTDYSTPNIAVDEGSADYNFYQHEPYLIEFNASNNTDVVLVNDPIFAPSYGIFSDKLDNLEDLKEGSKVAIYNDNTNRTFMLRFLEDLGFITLKEDVENLTVEDIIENPLDLEIIELDGPNVVRSIPDVDIAVCLSSRVKASGGDPNTALATLEGEGEYLATKNGNEDSDITKKVYDAYRSEEAKKHLEENYSGIIEPFF